MARMPLRVSAEQKETFRRTLQTFTVSRVLIVAVLFLDLSFIS